MLGAGRSVGSSRSGARSWRLSCGQAHTEAALLLPLQELRASTSQLGAILQSMDERLKRLELAVQLAEEQRAEAAGAAAGAEPAS